MLELSNSIMSKSIMLPIMRSFSEVSVGNIKARGINIKVRSNSCLKALSSLKANINPERLFIKAKYNLFNPVFFLCGFSLKTYVLGSLFYEFCRLDSKILTTFSQVNFFT